MNSSGMMRNIPNKTVLRTSQLTIPKFVLLASILISFT